MNNIKPVPYRETKKFNLWVKHYTDANNRKTYLNATQAAILAYHYISPKQYHLASVTGSKNMRKYKALALATLDSIHLGFGKLLKIGITKMLNGTYEDWELLMKRLGYFQ